MAWRSRATVLIFFFYFFSSCLFLSRVDAQLESDGCLKLESSKACRAFDPYYVAISALASSYSFLANVDSVSSFDTSLQDHLATTSPMQEIGCANNTQYARYSLTQTCALLIHNTQSLTCNYNRGVSPQPMCQSSCDEWVDSISTLLQKDGSQCSADSFQEQCDGWPAFSGTDGNCILGSDNEPDNCGFQDNNQAACDYCQNNSTDSCCSSVSCGAALSAGAIAGIVIGCVAAAAMMIAGIFYCWRRQRQRQQHPRDSIHGGSGGVGNNGGFVPISMQRYEDEARMNLVGGEAPMTPTEEKTQLPSTMSVEMAEVFCEVAHGYQPQMEDEMELREGDVVYLIFQLDDGWGYGLNLASSTPGVFPLVCVVQAREELLEQLLLPSSSSSSSNHVHNEKTLIEEEEEEHQDPERASMLSPNGNNSAIPSPLSSCNTSISNSALAARMQEFRDNVRRSISIGSLKRISRQPRPMPPVQVHHHDTMPTRRVSSIHRPLSPPLLSAPPVTSSSSSSSTPTTTTTTSRYALDANSQVHPLPPPPPSSTTTTTGEAYEMHHTILPH